MLMNFLRFSLTAITFLSFTKCEDVSLEFGAKTVYNNFRQCEKDSQIIACLKLKAIKLVDRALLIKNIPIMEGISLTKTGEESIRSFNNAMISPLDETTLPLNPEERNRELDFLLWDHIHQFFGTRSLQLKVNKFFSEESDVESTEEARKKDKKQNMYVYMMMMKGGMIALAYKGLALLAGKALLVSKIALTLAVIVAIKKLFSWGQHSQKTTYEIVKTPVVTHSHQYNGGVNPNAHYVNDFSNYEGGPYARSINPLEKVSRRTGLNAIDTQVPTRYTTHNSEPVEGRSLSDLRSPGQNIGLPFSMEMTGIDAVNNMPYAHRAAYRNQLQSNIALSNAITTEITPKSMTTQ